VEFEWAKLGESARQIGDAAGILRIRGAELDIGYVRYWVGELQVEPRWTAACRMAGARRVPAADR